MRSTLAKIVCCSNPASVCVSTLASSMDVDGSPCASRSRTAQGLIDNALEALPCSTVCNSLLPSHVPRPVFRQGAAPGGTGFAHIPAPQHTASCAVCLQRLGRDASL